MRNVKAYKLFWDTHKWIGIIFSAVFITIAVTGLLLPGKKKYHWIQSPTQEGAQGCVEDFITVPQWFEIALNQGHQDFKTYQDIDRIDFRPDRSTLTWLFQRRS